MKSGPYECDNWLYKRFIENRFIRKTNRVFKSNTIQRRYIIVLINDILDLAKVDAGKKFLLMSHSKYPNYLPVLFVYLKQKFKKATYN
jgi:hypothetical protein